MLFTLVLYLIQQDKEIPPPSCRVSEGCDVIDAAAGSLHNILMNEARKANVHQRARLSPSGSSANKMSCVDAVCQYP